jgi:hypothetical protein
VAALQFREEALDRMWGTIGLSHAPKIVSMPVGSKEKGVER